jgi:hypothetical protein
MPFRKKLIPVVAVICLASHQAHATNISPVFSANTKDKDSYLRLINPTSRAGDVTLTFKDSATGTTVGTWTMTVPGYGAHQKVVKDIERNGAFNIDPSLKFYDVKVDSTFNGFVQHVLWSTQIQAITNISSCGAAQAKGQRFINNVHTKNIPGYPSKLVVRNRGPEANTPRFKVYDADTGEQLFIQTFSNGFVLDNIGPFIERGTIQPGGEMIFDVATLMASLGLNVGSRQHLNFSIQGNGVMEASHYVDNTLAGVHTSMSDRCEIGPLANAQTLVIDPQSEDRSVTNFAAYKKKLRKNGITVLGTAKAGQAAMVQTLKGVTAVMEALRPDLRDFMRGAFEYAGVVDEDERDCTVGDFGSVCSNFDGRASWMLQTTNGQTGRRGKFMLRETEIRSGTPTLISVHEFAHNVQDVGIASLYPAWNTEITAAYNAAVAAGRLDGLYAGGNAKEFFADFSMAFLSEGSMGGLTVAQTAPARTRAELQAWDPTMYALMERIYPNVVRVSKELQGE